MSAPRSITRTFSLRKDLIDELEREAKSRDISTSTLMNHILQMCVKFTWPTEKTEAITLARDILEFLLNSLPSEEIPEFGSNLAKRLTSRSALIIGPKPTVDSVLELLQYNYSTYSRWFKYDHKIDGRDHVIVLTHSLGPKWSSFLIFYFESFFMEILGIKLKSSSNDNTVLLKFTNY